MQKQLFLGLAAASLLLTACSQDETVGTSEVDSNAIRIGVNIGSNSRAANSYCPHIFPSGFRLTAVHSGETNLNSLVYFLDTEMVLAFHGTAVSFADGSLRYWPEGALDFYAWHTTQSGPETNFAHFTEDGEYDPVITGFSVKSDVAAQEDLLYAVTPGAVKSESPVTLNLNHALAQVTFEGLCENEAINVTIRQVGITGIYGSGTFHFLPQPVASRLSLLKAPAMSRESGLNATDDEAPSARWEAVDDALTQTYLVNTPALLTSEAQPLSAVPSDHADTEGWANVMQLIPQMSRGMLAQANQNPQSILGLLQAPARRAAADEEADEPIKGIYNIVADEPRIVLNCRIDAPNAVLSEGDPESVNLFDSERTEQTVYIQIPFRFNWKEGFRYVYTINFGKKGNGGIIPGDDIDEPALTGIDVQVSVTEYDPEGNASQPMQAQNNDNVQTLL